MCLPISDPGFLRQRAPDPGGGGLFSPMPMTKTMKMKKGSRCNPWVHQWFSLIVYLSYSCLLLIVTEFE